MRSYVFPDPKHTENARYNAPSSPRPSPISTITSLHRKYVSSPWSRRTSPQRRRKPEQHRYVLSSGWRALYVDSIEQTEIHIDGAGAYYEVTNDSNKKLDFNQTVPGKKLEQAQINLNDCLACSYARPLTLMHTNLTPPQRMHHLCRIRTHHPAVPRRGTQLP